MTIRYYVVSCGSKKKKKNSDFLSENKSTGPVTKGVIDIINHGRPQLL